MEFFALTLKNNYKFNLKYCVVENIELWIIGILFATAAISLIMLKESKHFSKYWKDLYFIQKDLNEKMKKASDGNCNIPLASNNEVAVCDRCRVEKLKNPVVICQMCRNELDGI